MARYIPTTDGRGVLDVGEPRIGLPDSAHVISIDAANLLLRRWRSEAWAYAAGGSGYVANCFNSWANSLSDALTYAEELRGEGGNKNARAAA